MRYPDIEKYITENPNPSGGAPYLPQIRNWIEEETERKRIQIQLEINPSVNPIPSTVSGNSSGGSGINFGFLGTLGSTLKSLIENIGTAIVDVITGISTVIAEVVTNIPTVFGDFVGAVLGWLPPELQALISLSVVAMVTFGIIKLIRG